MESPRRVHSRYSESPSPHRSPYRSKHRAARDDSRNDHDSKNGPDVENDNPGNNLYVTGLSTRVTEKDLMEFFGKEGKVVECRLVVDPRTRESRGFGFVTMESVEDAEHCIKQLNRTALDSRIVTVEKAKRQRARTPTPGQYLGVRAGGRSRGSSRYGGDYRSGNGDYSRRSPRYSPYRRDGYYDRYDRSPEYSPYRGRSRHRRERSRSPYYSPHRR